MGKIHTESLWPSLPHISDGEENVLNEGHIQSPLGGLVVHRAPPFLSPFPAERQEHRATRYSRESPCSAKDVTME